MFNFKKFNLIMLIFALGISTSIPLQCGKNHPFLSHLAAYFVKTPVKIVPQPSRWNWKTLAYASSAIGITLAIAATVRWYFTSSKSVSKAVDNAAEVTKQVSELLTTMKQLVPPINTILQQFAEVTQEAKSSLRTGNSLMQQISGYNTQGIISRTGGLAELAKPTEKPTTINGIMAETQLLMKSLQVTNERLQQSLGKPKPDGSGTVAYELEEMRKAVTEMITNINKMTKRYTLLAGSPQTLQKDGNLAANLQELAASQKLLQTLSAQLAARTAHPLACPDVRAQIQTEQQKRAANRQPDNQQTLEKRYHLFESLIAQIEKKHSAKKITNQKAIQLLLELKQMIEKYISDQKELNSSLKFESFEGLITIISNYKQIIECESQETQQPSA
ncbi:TPA: hypothetical protein DEO28_03560 [Candidatus Dependentiae bacterium]|nr:MAG: hypothetical protein UR14_C0007G0013 [candidate division TM6 bacterium GW2011_GWE2_31_21]KKP53626.1 MAG: hypothetical protein UR43_C0004G0167 [candidate division TM6 bacterium GW2011_GWF2_33_332]HBS48134.1 hypothetical protein [Candidatus Dependentiae bacterium]HBZ73558.1 hypothetical protein [Candidatus Dependentiae bacterium]